MPLLSKECRLPLMYTNSHINFTARLEAHIQTKVVSRSSVEIQCSRISQRGLSALNMPNSKDAECVWSLTEYFHKSEFMSNLGDFLFVFCLFVFNPELG